MKDGALVRVTNDYFLPKLRGKIGIVVKEPNKRKPILVLVMFETQRFEFHSGEFENSSGYSKHCYYFSEKYLEEI